MGLVKPFYFRNRTLTWHKAVFINAETRMVISECGRAVSFARSNRTYEDTEVRPYTGKVCSRCEVSVPSPPLPSEKGTTPSGSQPTQKAEPEVHRPQLQIRKIEGLPTPMETYPGISDEQSPLGSGLSYDDAVRRKPKRILP